MGLLGAGVLAWNAGAATAAAETLARTRIPAGTEIEANMLEGQDADRFVGLEAKRTIWPGRPITRRDAGPPRLVQRNTVVEIFYRAGTLELRDEGRALEEGAEGDRIKVMNTDSRQVIRAVVTGPSQVSASP